MSFPRKRESEFTRKDEIIFPKDTEYFFIALFHTIKQLNIPVQEFRNLLIAFKQDALNSRYKNFEELISYSKNSANPIGHLILYVFGYDPDRDDFAFETSDKICTALQLTNFWQDVKRDLQIGRIYIPEEIMRKNDYTYEDLFKKNESENFRNIIK
jgi:phytoene/squalene synthetase